MAGLNEIVCSQEWGNTGLGTCSLIPKNIVGAFFSTKQISITRSETDDMNTKLSALVVEDKHQDRLFPLHFFVGNEDNSEDDVMEDQGYGGSFMVREGMYDWTFRLGKPSICQQRALRKFNNKTMYAFFYDADGNFFGIQDGNNMKSIPLNFYNAGKMVINSGDATTAFNVQVKFNANYFNDDLAFVATRSQDFLLETITGLQDVYFEVTDGAGTDEVELRVKGCGADIIDNYATELAVVGNWKVSNLTTGVANVVTSISVGDKTITLSLTTSEDTLINLADVSTLISGGISGYEGHAVVSKT